MPTAGSIDELCTRLGALAPGAIAAVEGFCGSGKSTLADQLAERVPAIVCHVDSFARKFEKPPLYTECLDLTRLRSTLEQRGMSRIAIVEGICLRDVLALVGVSPALVVYLKRIGGNGRWHDGLHLEDFQMGEPTSGDMDEPHRSDFEYHARVRPHERADLIYERVEH
jgi:hypothetical protein